MNKLSWEVVRIVDGPFQGELLKGLLEAQGIEAYLSQQGAAIAIGLTVGPMGEVEILVRNTDLEAAKQVLAAFDAGDFAQEAE